MLISQFDYELPTDLIAQEPNSDRSSSRMLVVDRSANIFQDARFLDLPTYLNKDDVLVLNNTEVFPARLFGRSETGSKIEIFLVREMGDQVWESLARPARRLKTGKIIHFGDKLNGEVLEKTQDGKVHIRFSADGNFDDILDEIGRTPLPPYIRRDASGIDADRQRYQTVFSSKRGAIAAPTAGLHFTPDVLEAIRQKGVEILEITLHVGYGTFEPVRSVDLDQHTVSAERYEISNATADSLNTAAGDGRRIVAVGTTTTRALESNLAENEHFTSGRHVADLTIRPGYAFKSVDSLLTNFHLPMSSLLVLTSTFGGHKLIMDAYRHAVSSRYRFYSYGDCMLIV
jgi:S-adenosylmethionine:tRNA ribosyltransferase-isomerase